MKYLKKKGASAALFIVNTNGQHENMNYNKTYINV